VNAIVSRKRSRHGLNFGTFAVVPNIVHAGGDQGL
jgi:hypothetical protein